MKPACYGGLNCPEDYKCPLAEACGTALFQELESVPLEAWRVIQRKLLTHAKQKIVKRRKLVRPLAFFYIAVFYREPLAAPAYKPTKKEENNRNE